MDPTEYQRLAGVTECGQEKSLEVVTCESALLGKARLQPIRLMHAAIGLTSDAGEVAAAVEQWIYYGQDLNVVNLIEELGDCLWYIALACNALELNLGEVMGANIRKLQKRYPDKFSEHKALEENRDRSAEREAVVSDVLVEASNLTNDSVQKLSDALEMVVAEEKPKPTIEEYRKSMRRDGRFVSPSYNRMCSTCGRAPVHKSNRSGICTDCGMELRSSSNVRGVDTRDINTFC